MPPPPCVSVPVSTPEPTITAVIATIVSMVALIVVNTTVTIAICCIWKKTKKEAAMAQRCGTHELNSGYPCAHAIYSKVAAVVGALEFKMLLKFVPDMCIMQPGHKLLLHSINLSDVPCRLYSSNGTTI